MLLGVWVSGPVLAYATAGSNQHIILADLNTRVYYDIIQAQGTHHSPSWSPDGSNLAFVLDGPEGSRIYAGRTGHARPVTPLVPRMDAPVHSIPTWSPDGQTVLYTVSTATSTARMMAAALTADKVEELEIRDPNTQHHLDRLRRESQPAPNAGRLLYIDRNDATDAWGIYIDEDGRQRLLYPLSRADLFLGSIPRWSPDGRWVTFTAMRDNLPQVFIINAEGGNPRRITRVGGQQPIWQP
jgi:TolB protein